MRWHSRVILLGILALSTSSAIFAQSNICQKPATGVPDEARAEQLRIQAEERARQDAGRTNWTANIVPLQNESTFGSLELLCIFGIEVVPQKETKLVAVRAPKELMPAVEEALKRLDAPVQAKRSVELTGYVIAISDSVEPGLQPLPAFLRPVADQLSSLLGGGTLYVVDTVVARGVDGQGVSIGGDTVFSVGFVSIQNPAAPAAPVLHLDRLRVMTNYGGGASFEATVDIPVGSQVVVGKVTARNRAPAPFPNSAPAPSRSLVFVVTAKIPD